jgi:hypothetical protein
MSRIDLMFGLFMAVELLLTSSIAEGQSFLFPGASVTFESGLSQTNTRGPVAIMNNPANTVITRKFEVYGDLTLVNVDYKYTRDGYDPVGIKLTAPPINLGFSFKPNPRIAFGAFITPRPAAKAQVVKNVPQDLGGEITLVDVYATQGAFISGFGLGFKINDNTSIGLSAIETAEDTQLIVRNAGTTDDKDALLGMRFIGSFFQVVGGVRHIPMPRLTLAGSFKTSVKKEYSGKLILKGDQDDSVKRKGFAPAVLSFGAEYRLGAPTLFGEMRREFWSSGSSSAASGLPGAPSSTDYLDTLIMIAGGRFKIMDDRVVSASIAYYPANVGDGSPTSTTVDPDAVGGVQFGEFDGISRTMFSASYRMSMKEWDIMGGFNFMSGSRTVPENYPGAGRYELTVFSLGAGVSRYFR